MLGRYVLLSYLEGGLSFVLFHSAGRVEEKSEGES